MSVLNSWRCNDLAPIPEVFATAEDLSLSLLRDACDEGKPGISVETRSADGNLSRSSIKV